MMRTRFLVAGVMVTLGLIAPSHKVIAGHQNEPPNILIFMTDDQRLGTMRAMPGTRRWFGQNGVTYNNGFVTTPLCCPSRASLFTGQYVHNHGVEGNDDAENIGNDSTLQKILQDEGYLTALAGKYLNQWPMVDSPLDFDRFAMLRQTDDAKPYIRPTFNFDGTVRTLDKYSTSVIQRRAVKFLTAFNRNNDDRPWLMYVTPFAPHSPAIPAPRHADAPVSRWHPAPSVFEKDRSDKPPIVRSQNASVDAARSRRAKMLRTLMSVDDMVVELMNLLRNLGETTRTMAFFLSDNGHLWAEHRWAQGKRVPYVESIKVPFFMRWPGHTVPGTKQGRFVANIDIAPTVLDALGLGPPEPMDGRSLLQPNARDRIFTEYFYDAGVPPWASIWTPQYQYTEWYNRFTGDVTFREYYNLVADPYQMKNLLGDGSAANDPSPQRLAELETQLQEDRICVAAKCP